jgi:hypothetical protein
MKVRIEFEGFEELQKKLWEASSEEALKAVNKKIIKSGQDYGKELVKKRVPKSLNVQDSGPKRGRARSIPGKHAADNIPVDGIKTSNGQMFGFIGWRPSDNSENFYAKFFEEGVDKHLAPQNYNRPVPKIAKLELFSSANEAVITHINEIGVEEYQKKLEEVMG